MLAHKAKISKGQFSKEPLRGLKWENTNHDL